MGGGGRLDVGSGAEWRKREEERRKREEEWRKREDERREREEERRKREEERRKRGGRERKRGGREVEQRCGVRWVGRQLLEGMRSRLCRSCPSL
jgi:hypothetical protein